jgi:hypothetical protein
MFFWYKKPARLHTAEMSDCQPDIYDGTGNGAIVAKRTILSIFTKNTSDWSVPSIQR